MFQNMSQLILKMTKDCNLRCKYCYIDGKDEFKNQMMTFEFYTKVVDKIVDDLKLSDRKNNFQLIFHGGEPTLAGVSLLRKCFEYVTMKFREVQVNLTIGIQTNLTLINDDMCFLFRDYNVQVGCSFDGFGISNKLRSLASTDIFMEKISLLKKHGVQFGFLTVITSQNSKFALKNTQKLLRKCFPEDKTKLQNIKMNIVEDVTTPNTSDIEITGDEMFDTIVKPSIEYWIKTGKFQETNMRDYISRFVTSRISHYNKNIHATCGTRFCGGGSTIIELEPDGTGVYCGRYSKNSREIKSCHILENDFLELNQIQRFIDRTEKHNKSVNGLNCDDCQAKDVCNTGCEAFHYSKFGTWGIREDIVCGFYKPLMRWMLENEEIIMDRFVKNYLSQESGSIGFVLTESYGHKNNVYFNKALRKYDAYLNHDSSLSDIASFTIKRLVNGKIPMNN